MGQTEAGNEWGSKSVKMTIVAEGGRTHPGPTLLYRG
jgi:hypothetical protein